MRHLPNEILDKIWLERCKLGFEPRIVQAKWVHDGRFYVPKFYGAQPQEPMTQLCCGARNVVAWNGFYSRILDGYFTGVGGFWWSEKDVLYVDRDFFERLLADRNSIFMGRHNITRVAIDVKVAGGTRAVVKVLLDWFPMLSQVFFLVSARLFPASELKRLTRPTPDQMEEYRSVVPKGFESESTKSLPIVNFHKVRGMFSRGYILDKLFIRWSDSMPHPGSRFAHIDCLIFERADEPNALIPSSLLPKHSGAAEDPMTLQEAEQYVATRTLEARRLFPPRV